MQWQVHYCTGQKTCVDENEAHCKNIIQSHTARWVEGACILQSQEFFKRCCNSCCRGFFDEFGLEAIMDGADPNSITEKAIVVTTKAVTEAKKTTTPEQALPTTAKKIVTTTTTPKETTVAPTTAKKTTTTLEPELPTEAPVTSVTTVAATVSDKPMEPIVKTTTIRVPAIFTDSDDEADEIPSNTTTTVPMIDDIDAQDFTTTTVKQTNTVSSKIVVETTFAKEETAPVLTTALDDTSDDEMSGEGNVTLRSGALGDEWPEQSSNAPVVLKADPQDSRSGVNAESLDQTTDLPIDQTADLFGDLLDLFT